MQTLRSKAHLSLQEYRDGKQSPLTSMLPYKPFEGTPEADDGDELSKLGGKTRLISQKENKPPSPLMTRSPNTHNPIVPLPLQPDGSSSIHPSVLDYLSTFPVPGQGGRSDAHYQNRDVFAVPQSGLYRFEDDQTFSSQLPTPTSATNPNNSLLLPSPHSHSHIHPHQNQNHPSSSSHGGNSQPYFPQYFPVFDYGASSAYGSSSMHPPNQSSVGSSSAGMSSLSYDQDHTMSYDGSVMPGQVNGMNGYAQKDPREISPDTSMHSTWMDLVTQMSGINGNG